MPWGLGEMDVHDVLNIFQVTGLDEEGRYCMSECPAEKGDSLEFLAETDVLMALSESPLACLFHFRAAIRSLYWKTSSFPRIV